MDLFSRGARSKVARQIGEQGLDFAMRNRKTIMYSAAAIVGFFALIISPIIIMSAMIASPFIIGAILLFMYTDVRFYNSINI